MQRFTRSTLLALALAATAPSSAFAQSGTADADPPQEPKGINDTMNAEAMRGNGTMPMMRMMMECANTMKGVSGSGAMSGGMGGLMGPGSKMHDGMTAPMEGAEVDVATAEVVALAYLHGRNPEWIQETEILDAAVEDGRYVVTYQRGDADGVVLVDAATGTIVPETP